jgi:hypothetical protein
VILSPWASIAFAEQIGERLKFRLHRLGCQLSLDSSTQAVDLFPILQLRVVGSLVQVQTEVNLAVSTKSLGKSLVYRLTRSCDIDSSEGETGRKIPLVRYSVSHIAGADAQDEFYSTPIPVHANRFGEQKIRRVAVLKSRANVCKRIAPPWRNGVRPRDDDGLEDTWDSRCRARCFPNSQVSCGKIPWHVVVSDALRWGKGYLEMSNKAMYCCQR